MSYWIHTAERPDTTHFYYFHKEIELPFDPSQISAFRLSVCADSRYRLYINGTYVGEGPCQGSEYSRYFETYDGAETVRLLRPGKNEFCVKVLYLEEGSFISIFRGSRPALWLDGQIKFSTAGVDNSAAAMENAGFSTITGSEAVKNAENVGENPQNPVNNAPEAVNKPVETIEEFSFGTDAGWQCEREDNVCFRHFPGVHTSTPPGEEYLGASMRTVVDVIQAAPPVPRGYNLFGLADRYPLEARPIPQLEYEPSRPFKTVRRGDNYAELDAGVYTTALPTFTFTGAPGSVIKITYSESYVVRDAEGRPYKARRDAYDLKEAEFSGIVYDVVHLPDCGKLTFTPFWYRAFRFVRLDFSDPSVQVPELTFSSCFYPLKEDGGFRCSDAALNEMWKVSVNTVKCCAHEMYIDCPYFEQQQYDMDSCLEMLFTQRMSSDPRLPLKSVTDMARSQIFNGMLQANYPSVLTQIIPNFTLFWVIMLREYLRYAPFCDETRREAAAFLGTVDKALESFELFRDATGLVGDNPYWSFVDWVPGWFVGVTPGGREGEPLTVASLLFVKALRDAADISEYCGRTARADEYRARADALAALIIEKCFDAEAGLFRNTPARREFSEHTSLWAVLSGTVDGEAARTLMQRTLDGSVPVAHCSFSMGFFLFRAIEKTGLYDEYAPRLFAGWQRMLDNHCTTWCENPDSPRSECHGWSSAPAYEFSAMVLGAYPEANGYRRLRIRPHLFAFETNWAEGSIPTPFGAVNIRLSRLNGAEKAFSIHVALPDGRVFEQSGCRDGDQFLFDLG